MTGREGVHENVYTESNIMTNNDMTKKRKSVGGAGQGARLYVLVIIASIHSSESLSSPIYSIKGLFSSQKH